MGGFPHFFKLSGAPIASGPDDCSFTILTTLASPSAEIISKVQVDDVLLIAINGYRLEAYTQQHELCGIILGSIERVKLCIAKGVEFEAKVVIRDGAQCQVLIEKSSK